MTPSKIVRATPEQIELYNQIWDHFGTQAKAAEALKVSQAAIHQYCIGRMAMKARVARRAEHETGGKFKAEKLCLDLADDFESEAA